MVMSYPEHKYPEPFPLESIKPGAILVASPDIEERTKMVEALSSYLLKKGKDKSNPIHAGKSGREMFHTGIKVAYFFTRTPEDFEFLELNKKQQKVEKIGIELIQYPDVYLVIYRYQADLDHCWISVQRIREATN
jgi:hypothetical protein